MMPSFSALRLAGRLRPTVSTAPDFSILSSVGLPAAAAAAFPMGAYWFLSRIVMFYNDWGRSQLGDANAGRQSPYPPLEGEGRLARSEMRDGVG